MILATAAAFIPVAAVADVSNSKGSHYRVETCFVAPERLSTVFVYPDRKASFSMRDGVVRVGETGAPEATGSDAERRFAFGHNFHAIALNAAQWGKGESLAMPFGGTMSVLARAHGMPSKMRFDSPDTTPVELSFSDWRGTTPYRLELLHAGVTYDYRFRSVERRCNLD